MRPRDTEKRNKIKSHAIETIVKEGFDQFSIQKLAKACSISVGTIYIYFKDKEALISTIAQEVSDAYYQAMLKNFSPDMDLHEGLWVQWENRANFAIKEPIHLAFHDLLLSSPLFPLTLTPLHEQLTESFSHFVKNHIQKGNIKPMSGEVYSSLVYGPLNHLIRFHQRGRTFRGKPYSFSKEDMRESFEYVLKILQ
jgi:TetR/AcrR family transcriptional repressor of multidrug resistance operon